MTRIFEKLGKHGVGKAALLGTASLLFATAVERWQNAAVAADPIIKAHTTDPNSSTPGFRRLTEEQYRLSIAQIFGPDIVVGGRFEPPVREDGLLAIGDSKVIVTPAGMEQYAARAKDISEQVLAPNRREKFLKCAPSPNSFDPICARDFFTQYGRLLLRRPLARGELQSVMTLAQQGARTSGDFYKGMQAGLSSLLLSPAFVFRMEVAQADPASSTRERLDAYSLASRLSFLLWNAPPDAELLDAAASGALNKPDGLNSQVDRLMSSPRLEQGVRAFFADMLAYDQFNGLSKDAALFPIFTPRLRDDAQEQSMRTIIDHLLVMKKDYRDLFTTKKTFLSRSLGALYGVRVDHRAFDGWMPYTFPAEDPHSGLLTLAGFLMLDPTHEGRSSPTIRGKVVRENLLCQPVPPPPANVNFDLVQNVDDPVRKTARERLTAHQDNPVCAGCHRMTDPIGLSLENFTSVGGFRTHENGVEIDASGKFEGKSYRNAAELTRLLHDSSAVPSCVVQRLYEYGVGRKLAASEEDWLGSVDSSFAEDGYRFPALLRRIATSPAFQGRPPATTPAGQRLNVAFNAK
jgi:hypothetical protein